MKTLLFIFGTRPEAIKLAPLIKEFEKNSSVFKTVICATAQHRELLDQVLGFYQIQPHYDLNIMHEEQTPFDITSFGLKQLENVFSESKPDLVFVQGDTTSSFIGALAAFYSKVRVVHIEAGLRSGDKYSPFTEEMNRKLISTLADFHFAPTDKAVKNLHDEGIEKNVWKVGNTAIDALLLCLRLIKDRGEHEYAKFFNFIDFSKKVILVTCHRRENFGKPLEAVCNALIKIVKKEKDTQIIYPVHLNPQVKITATKILENVERIHLIDPLTYPHFVWLMNKSTLIITDSGGIQEEAPSLGKPVLVIRNVTERTEGIDAGTSLLVGTDENKITHETLQLLTVKERYNRMARACNPYGDGTSSLQIVSKIKEM